VSASNHTTAAGPWPEPEPEFASARDALDPLAEPESQPKGSKGVSVGVAVLSVGYLVSLPVLLAVGIYTFITVYAIVKAISSGPDTADAAVVLIGIVGLVTFFVLLLGGGLWAIGRTADPKKRGR
jgi:hypothetical protein